jgi:hypothetical protein
MKCNWNRSRTDCTNPVNCPRSDPSVHRRARLNLWGPTMFRLNESRRSSSEMKT